MDPRIGTLNSGKFYAFANGYDNPEVIGTLSEVEAALGIQSASVPEDTSETWDVLMTFEFPAWDEVCGIPYNDIQAQSASEANAIARSYARRDGHACTGRGRYSFKAKKQ